MLNFFKTNHPSAIIYLLVYMLVLKLMLFIIPLDVSYDITAPLSELIYNYLFNFAAGNTTFYTISGILLIFIQALMINQVFSRHKMIKRPTYVPAMSYILMTSLYPEFTLFPPALIANTFLIMALNKLFLIFDKEREVAPIFDAGLLTGVASLFYFPAVFFILVIFTGLIIIKTFQLRDLIITVLGLITPYFLISTYYFWHDRLFLFLKTHIFDSFTRSYQLLIEAEAGVLIKAAVLGMIFIFILIRVQSRYFKSIVKARKILVILIWYFFMIIASFLVEPMITLNHFVLAAVPFAVLFYFYISTMKSRRIPELIHLFLILIILFFQFSALFNLEFELPV